MRLSAALALAFLVFGLPGPDATARASELVVLSSGGLGAALDALAPGFEAKTGHKINRIFAPSMGTSAEAIPNRLARGEPADVLVMVGAALGKLVTEGKVIATSRVDIANSKIALAVRAGAPKPDISTLDAFKQTLLRAASIAYSDSASGVYIESEMYAKLGLVSELKPKSRMIVRDPVGGVVAAGGAEIGFQQLAELITIDGIKVVGLIPDEVQKITLYSAAIPVGSRDLVAAKALIDALASPEAAPIIEKAGMEPLARP